MMLGYLLSYVVSLKLFKTMVYINDCKGDNNSSPSAVNFERWRSVTPSHDS